MVVGYVRVSTEEQNEARQVKQMEEHGVEKVFVEKKSGKNIERPVLNEVLRYVREGDTLCVCDFSRLSRNTLDLVKLVKELNDRGVSLISFKESIDTSTAQGKFLLYLFGALAEMERELMLERQRDGIAVAKAEGKYKGRKAKDLNVEILEKVIAGELSVSGASRLLNVTRPTIYNMVSRYKNDACVESV